MVVVEDSADRALSFLLLDMFVLSFISCSEQGWRERGIRIGMGRDGKGRDCERASSFAHTPRAQNFLL